MAIDLRSVMHGILRKWGHNVILQRRVHPETHHGPFALKENNGYSSRLERHTVRRRYARTARLPYNAIENEEGWTHDPTQIYYFRWDANPGEGDRIYEQDPAVPQKYTTWLISEVFAERGLGGRVEYWIVGTLREHPT